MKNINNMTKAERQQIWVAKQKEKDIEAWKEKRREAQRKYRAKLIAEGKPIPNGYKKKEKIVKIKIKTSGKTYIKKDKNVYLDSDELTRLTILSQGTGKPSLELINSWYKMIDEIGTKFTTPYELRKDTRQDTILLLYKNYMNYNDIKYGNAFSYFSEIIKRSYTNTFNKWVKYSKDLGYDKIRY